MTTVGLACGLMLSSIPVLRRQKPFSLQLQRYERDRSETDEQRRTGATPAAGEKKGQRELEI